MNPNPLLGVTVARWIVGVIFLLAFVAAIVWALRSPGYEAAITAAVLLGSLLASFFERLAASRERRFELLFTLCHELLVNKKIIRGQELDPLNPPTSIRVYPRFHLSTAQSVAASGILSRKRDRKLVRLLHSWLQRGSDFNVLLGATDMLAMAHPTAASPAALHGTITGSPAFTAANEALTDLMRHLVESYPKQSGVGRDTVLFQD